MQPIHCFLYKTKIGSLKKKHHSKLFLKTSKHESKSTGADTLEVLNLLQSFQKKKIENINILKIFRTQN